MKRLVLWGVVCTFAAAPLWAGPTPTNGEGWNGGTANWDRSYYQGRGGEFTLYASTLGSLLLSNAAYAASTKDMTATGSFQTFCVETDEFVDSDMRIWVSESSVEEPAIYGSGSHA